MISKEIDEIAACIQKGIDNWRTAGNKLVELSKRQPDIFDRITARHPHISRDVLEVFARIGRKEIWPPLLMSNSLGAKKLLECNYDIQKELADKPIKVATHWKNNVIQHAEKRIHELSKAEVAMVFDGQGGVNNLDQQAWRLRNAGKEPEPAKKVLGPKDPAPEYAPPRMVNVDIGYFSIVVAPDGAITCTPCGKSPMAQPVRVIPNGTGHKSAIVLCYKQEYKS